MLLRCHPAWSYGSGPALFGSGEPMPSESSCRITVQCRRCLLRPERSCSDRPRKPIQVSLCRRAFSMDAALWGQVCAVFTSLTHRFDAVFLMILQSGKKVNTARRPSTADGTGGFWTSCFEISKTKAAKEKACPHPAATSRIRQKYDCPNDNLFLCRMVSFDAEQKNKIESMRWCKEEAA